MRRNSGCRGDGLTARAAAAGAAAGVWAAGDSAATAADAAAATAAAAAWAVSEGRGCWRGSRSDTSTCVPRINRELVCGKKETNYVLNYARVRAPNRLDAAPNRFAARPDSTPCRTGPTGSNQSDAAPHRIGASNRLDAAPKRSQIELVRVLTTQFGPAETTQGGTNRCGVSAILKACYLDPCRKVWS